MDPGSRIFIELGSVAVGLAILARLASRLGSPPCQTNLALVENFR